MKSEESKTTDPPTISKCPCSIKYIIKNLPAGKAKSMMSWFSRPQRSGTRIGLEGQFKRFHWWEAMRHQPKWRAKLASSSTTDPWVSSSDRMGEEEVTRPIDQDRAKAATWKEKAKED
jgi:hypothetical protein